MSHHTKLAFAAIAATLLLGLAVTTATANRIAKNEQQNHLTFAAAEFQSSLATLRCAVTLEGSFHKKTQEKTAETLIGYVTSAIVGTCTGGTTRFNTETLPWHIRYVGFTGTLPNITAIIVKVIRPSFTIEVTGINCRYTPTEVTAKAARETVTGRITSAEYTRSNITSETGGLCPNANRLVGANGSVRSGTGGELVITLVQ